MEEKLKSNKMNTSRTGDEKILVSKLSSIHSFLSFFFRFMSEKKRKITEKEEEEKKKREKGIETQKRMKEKHDL